MQHNCMAPDRLLYQLLMKEGNPEKALDNFRECLKKVNSADAYNKFLNSGFNVIVRDEARTIEEILALVEKAFRLV